MPHILRSSAKNTKSTKYGVILSQRFSRFYRNILSFNEYLGITCYHTTWKNVARTEMLKRKQKFKRSGIKTRPFCFESFFFFMDGIVETSSNSMAEDFSRSKLSTAGGHGRSRK